MRALRYINFRQNKGILKEILLFSISILKTNFKYPVTLQPFVISVIKKGIFKALNTGILKYTQH